MTWPKVSSNSTGSTKNHPDNDGKGGIHSQSNGGDTTTTQYPTDTTTSGTNSRSKADQDALDKEALERKNEAYAAQAKADSADQKKADDAQIAKNKAETDKNKSSYENYMSGADMSGAAMLGANAYIAAKNAAENLALSIIGQKAAMAAAMLKLMNDLNDATVSFVKNIGSSVKSAAQ